MTNTITATDIHPGYAPTEHPDVVIRPLDYAEMPTRPPHFFFCSCVRRNPSIAIVRHIPTGARSLVCERADLHTTPERLTRFAEARTAQAAQLRATRAEEEAYIAANPDDTEFRDHAHLNWAALDGDPTANLPA